jgi:hypothetical protein
MGKFPWKDVKKAVFFGLVIWFSTWVKSWSWIKGLNDDHGWTDAQTALLATVIASVIGFLIFSAIFARPVMHVRWNRINTPEEQPGPRLSVPSDGTGSYVLIMRLSSQSLVGDLAIRGIKKMELRPTVMLGSPDYVRVVAERAATTIQPDGKGTSGVRCTWGGTLEKAVLHCAARIVFPVNVDSLVASEPNRLKYSLQLEPAVEQASSHVKRGVCWSLARFVHVEAKVTSIYVE